MNTLTTTEPLGKTDYEQMRNWWKKQLTNSLIKLLPLTAIWAIVSQIFFFTHFVPMVVLSVFGIVLFIYWAGLLNTYLNYQKDIRQGEKIVLRGQIWKKEHIETVSRSSRSSGSSGSVGGGRGARSGRSRSSGRSTTTAVNHHIYLKPVTQDEEPTKVSVSPYEFHQFAEGDRVELIKGAKSDTRYGMRKLEAQSLESPPSDATHIPELVSARPLSKQEKEQLLGSAALFGLPLLFYVAFGAVIISTLYTVIMRDSWVFHDGHWKEVAKMAFWVWLGLFALKMLWALIEVLWGTIEVKRVAIRDMIEERGNEKNPCYRLLFNDGREAKAPINIYQQVAVKEQYLIHYSKFRRIPLTLEIEETGEYIELL